MDESTEVNVQPKTSILIKEPSYCKLIKMKFEVGIFDENSTIDCDSLLVSYDIASLIKSVISLSKRVKELEDANKGK